MAQNATVFRAELQIADVERAYYGSHTLTLARHPSETDERMMVRLLAFALYANDALLFGKGISTEDEPALWQKDLTGAIERWIDVGLPDERDIRKACNRARHVTVVAYGRNASLWWEQHRGTLSRLANLTVIVIPVNSGKALAELATRTMRLHFTIQEGGVWIATEGNALELAPEVQRVGDGDSVLGRTG